MIKKVEKILETLDKAKLENVKVYDLKSTNPFFNYIIVSTATNKRQLSASLKYLDEEKIEYNHIEGEGSTEWVLVDASDILINIFTDEARKEYGLDNLYQEYLVK